MISKIIYYLPLLNIGLSSYILKSREKIKEFFLLLIINVIINYILKFSIKEPRPIQNHNFDIYGMPSGHAQIITFLTFYIYYKTKNIYLFVFNLICLFMVMIQRIISNEHSETQVLFGSFIGFIFSSFFS
jgi:membrane-associated phospholipid phosphatase